MVCLWKGGINDICAVQWRSLIGCDSWCDTCDDNDVNDDGDDDDGGGCDVDHDGDDDHHYYHGIDVSDHGYSDYDNNHHICDHNNNRDDNDYYNNYSYVIHIFFIIGETILFLRW